MSNSDATKQQRVSQSAVAVPDDIPVVSKALHDQEVSKLHSHIGELELEVKSLKEELAGLKAEGRDARKLDAEQGRAHLNTIDEMLAVQDQINRAGDLRLDSRQVQELRDRHNDLLQSMVE
jgi:molecular chaperone GrpE (heat shock protein)